MFFSVYRDTVGVDSLRRRPFALDDQGVLGIITRIEMEYNLVEGRSYEGYNGVFPDNRDKVPSY